VATDQPASPENVRGRAGGMWVCAWGGVLIILAGTGIALPSLYWLHVESEFRSFMNERIAGRQFEVKESRCLGKASSQISLWPILKSRFTNAYPYLSEEKDPKGKAYMQCTYSHGYFFNYCRIVQVDGRQLTAYWSLKEDRWRLGQLVWVNPNNVWAEYQPSLGQTP
jgi:hypothetical protein